MHHLVSLHLDAGFVPGCLEGIAKKGQQRGFR